MKQVFISFLIFISGLLSKAQTPTFQSAYGFGSIYHDYAWDITRDNLNNTYVVGDFSGTIDFDPGPGVYNITEGSNRNIYVLKLDASENLAWARSVSGNSTSIPTSIKVDNSGNVYSTGFISGIADFDPGPGSYTLSSISPPQSVFIYKLDVNGNFVWVKQIKATVLGVGNSLSLDGTGNVYVAGNFSGTADFDPGASVFNLTSNGASDIFLLKLDSNGNFIWAKQIGGTQPDAPYYTYIDANNIYTTGFFEGIVDFDPGTSVLNLSGNGGSDVFISKLDLNGNLLWAKNCGGTQNDEGRFIALDGTGNIYLTGNFNGTVDFDPGLGTSNSMSAGSTDAFALKLDASGNYIWAKSMGGGANDWNYKGAIDSDNSIYLCGQFSGISDFDPGPSIVSYTSAGSDDAYILKLDSNGVFSWFQQIGNSFQNAVWSMYVSPTTGDLHATGFYSQIADFDGSPATYTLSTNGGYDFFVLKLSGVVANINESVNTSGIRCYPNPTPDNFYFDLKSESQTIISNVLGQEILNELKKTGKQNINLQNQPNGIYFVKIIQEGKQYFTKIIKE